MSLVGEQIVSLHTSKGVQLYQFLSNGISSLKWTRELRETSICDLTVPANPEYSALPDITPWLHWVSVWNSSGDEMYWSGPVQRVEGSRDALGISARDVSALASRTRSPKSKKWDAVDPSVIAGEMWEAMIELHGLNIKHIERVNPQGDRFDYEAQANASMVRDVINDLVGLGLYWSVVSNTPILGPAPLKAIATLGEEDFLGASPTIIRDGTASYNDVLLRGADSIARARVAMGGLNLQALANVDSMFGVSNAERAVKQLVRHTGVIHDSVSLPDGATLHPDAPLAISQLMPSVRIAVDASGLLSTMELTRVTVDSNAETGHATVGVTMNSVNDDLPELLDTADVTIA